MAAAYISLGSVRKQCNTCIGLRKLEAVYFQAAAYARVSSDSEDQLNSCPAQVDFYVKCLTSGVDWEMVDIYEGGPVKTGLNQKHPAARGHTGLVLLLSYEHRVRIPMQAHDLFIKGLERLIRISA